MKRIWFLPFLALLFLAQSAFAGPKSTIRFRLSDGDLIRIVVNGRYFNKTARSITLGDIPGKNQNVKIYRFRPYNNKPGGMATLLFSGKIKIEKGQTYDAVVDTKTNQLYLTPVNQLAPIPSEMPAPQDNVNLQNQNALAGSNESNLSQDEPQADEASAPTTTPAPAVQLSPEMNQLKKQVESQVTDAGKLKIIRNYLQKASVLSSGDATTISGWLLFDDTRLTFLKEAYEKVSDKPGLEAAMDTFTEDTDRQAFGKFLDSKGD